MNAECEQGVRGRKRRERGKFLPLGEETPLYKPYRHVPFQRVGFLRRFGLKMGEDCSFWSGIGYGFRGNYGSV